MRVTRHFAGCPAPVAPLPPQGSPRSAPFSMARSVTFSTAIDRKVPKPRRVTVESRDDRPAANPETRSALGADRPSNAGLETYGF